MKEQSKSVFRSKRLLLNSIMSLTGRGSSLASTTVILLLIAYWRGSASTGVYSLATKYTTIALGLASFGLDSLLIRDLAQNPRQAWKYVRGFSLLRLFTVFFYVVV